MLAATWQINHGAITLSRTRTTRRSASPSDRSGLDNPAKHRRDACRPLEFLERKQRARDPLPRRLKSWPVSNRLRSASRVWRVSSIARHRLKLGERHGLAAASLLGGSLNPMAHHKRKWPRHRRSGCLLWRPQKLAANRRAARLRADNSWCRHEQVTYVDPPHDSYGGCGP